ncbi:hypothetical protein PIB30_051210 [Stylosanthes scabra]|uniref:Uncharacterized protein n=1 Tax=Stylosanthes scabra TaxID=79078 RepID=A0ABU6ZGN2_9FABA|nr:hypothetical protein [Stylosanthes scabra]
MVATALPLAGAGGNTNVTAKMGLPATENSNDTAREVTGEDERRWLEPWMFCLPQIPSASLGLKTTSTVGRGGGGCGFDYAVIEV